MKAKIIKVKGKPHLVIISYEEYLDLLKAAEKPKQLQIPRQKVQTKKVLVPMNDEVPEEVRRRIANGESPVKAWRLYGDLTQAELAKMAGVSNSAVSLIETRYRRGTKETYLALARALGVPKHLLFDK